MTQKPKSALFVLLGGFVAALLSASCCLVPTLFLLFGVSFAGVLNVAALEEYRWLFTLLAVVMLSVGLYSMVFKKQIKCECKKSLTSRVLSAAFWTLLCVSIAVLLYPWYEALIWAE